MEFIRAFIAIELDEEVKQDLERVESLLRGRIISGVNWVDPRSIHLTLKFLGRTPSLKLGDILQGLEGVASQVAPFRLRLGQIGGFPNLKRPRVIWVGLDGDIEVLCHLQGDISRAMESLGFPPEERVFKAHLTLGRVRERLTLDEGFLEACEAMAAEIYSSDGFWVRSVSLMRSELTPRGAVYTRMGQALLS